MRELRFVRLSEDGSRLVVTAPDDGEQFGVVVEAPLRAAVAVADQRADAEVATAPPVTPPAAPADAVGAPGSSAAEQQPRPATPTPLVPREVQVRVRGGESPEDVAASLGVELDRVMRFAMPVVDERRRIAEEARRARARHTAPEGAESKVVVFGEAVDARYAAHGIDPAAVEWDSFRRPDGEWVVVAHWLGGEGRHGAEWLFHRTSRSVTPVDDTAADLLSDRPIRPITPPQPQQPRLVVAPPLAPGVVAFPPMPEAHTAPIQRIEEVFDQEAPTPLPAALRPALVRDERTLPTTELPRDVDADATPDARADTAPGTAPDTANVDFDAPPLPLGIVEPAGQPHPARRARRETTDDDRAARARIPSWDDILLGVRRKSD